MNTLLVSSQIVHKCLGDCQEYELRDRFTQKLLFLCNFEVMFRVSANVDVFKLVQCVLSMRTAERGETIPKKIFTNVTILDC